MRKAETYRAAKRNAKFGRKPRGNTKPEERRVIRVEQSLAASVKAMNDPKVLL